MVRQFLKEDHFKVINQFSKPGSVAGRTFFKYPAFSNTRALGANNLTVLMFEEIDDIELLASARTNDLTEAVDQYFKVAKELQATNKHNYITRANFILEQINGHEGKEIFDKYREDWDIYDFRENILTVDDFKRGFLWRFRDHTTSWCDNEKAKGWFLTSTEGIFVRRYELWSCDKGFDECIAVKQGSYKEILLSLLKEGDYAVLCSPAFSKIELLNFIKTYDPVTGDYPIEVIIEDYIDANPNYDSY